MAFEGGCCRYVSSVGWLEVGYVPSPRQKEEKKSETLPSSLVSDPIQAREEFPLISIPPTFNLVPDSLQTLVRRAVDTFL